MSDSNAEHYCHYCGTVVAVTEGPMADRVGGRVEYYCSESCFTAMLSGATDEGDAG